LGRVQFVEIAVTNKGDLVPIVEAGASHGAVIHAKTGDADNV
jgi:hypothetical protein